MRNSFNLADVFWHLCSRRVLKTLRQNGNCSWWALTPFATMFTTHCSNFTFINGDFQYFWLDDFKYVCCIFVVCWEVIINPFPHIDAFWRLCSRQLLKTLWQKKKLLKTSSFWTQCFQLYSISMSSFREIFNIIVEMFSAANLLHAGKGSLNASGRGEGLNSYLITMTWFSVFFIILP